MPHDTAIRVENLGKRYRLHHRANRGGAYQYKSLRDVLAEAAAAPFRALKNSLFEQGGRAGREADAESGKRKAESGNVNPECRSGPAPLEGERTREPGFVSPPTSAAAAGERSPAGAALQSQKGLVEGGIGGASTSPQEVVPPRPVHGPLSMVHSPAVSEDFWALRDVSFEIKRGEVVGIIGRNGAGKSTLLKILSRITEPTTGRVDLFGRVGSLLEVGTGFHPELTGRENIFLNGAILGMKRWEINAKFNEIVEFAEIAKFLDTPVKHYSSGMYMRLAFAVAAHLDPEILLIDEVLAVGDVEFQKKCLGKMEDIARAGRTVLFVSHNLVAVKALCSRALVLETGLVKCMEPTAKAVEVYLKHRAVSSGEVRWDNPAEAPGNHQVRLHAVRIVSDGHVTGMPPVDKPIEIQIDYWNLEPGGRRLVSIHLANDMQYRVFASANWKSACLMPDCWVDQPYPLGLFRTTCVVPAFLLNPGRHSVDAYINGIGATDNIVSRVSAVAFEVQEVERFRSEFLGEWTGAVRPLLHWDTKRLDASS